MVTKKQTSAKISSKAAKYMGCTDDELYAMATDEDRAEFFKDVRSMAASLVSQDETKKEEAS